MKEVEIEALAPFNKRPDGDICEVGERFAVEEGRARELEESRLAKRTGKAAPAPSNKMAPEPDNKGEAAPQKAVTAAQSAERIKRVKLSGGQA